MTVEVVDDSIAITGRYRSVTEPLEDFRDNLEGSTLAEPKEPEIPGWSYDFGLSVVRALSSDLAIEVFEHHRGYCADYIANVIYTPDGDVFGDAKLDPERLASFTGVRLIRPVSSGRGECSFCGREHYEKLIGGTPVKICDRCILLTVDIMVHELGELPAPEPRPSPPDEIPGESYCSFCGFPRSAVAILVSGPRVFICDACASISYDLIRSDSGE